MAQNFQPIIGSLLRRQHVVILTSHKLSKETENRVLSCGSVYYELKLSF